MNENSPFVILKPGCKVSIIGGLYGVVVGALIEGDRHVTYKVAFASGNTFEEKWLVDFLVTPKEAEHMEIGFASTRD